MKSCSKCKQTKENIDFTPRSRSWDGLEARCRLCRNEDKRIREKKEVPGKRGPKKRFTEVEIKQRVYLGNKNWKAKNKEKSNAWQRAWSKKHPEKGRAREAKRRAAKDRATPSWLTKQDFKIIEEFYKNCPQGYEVDHILPLRGKEISGLHVLWNLQYLTVSENRSKINKLIT